MKNWPLGAKLTGWSALIVGLSLLVCGIGAVVYFQHEQIEFLDDQLRNEAHIFFAQVSHQTGDPGQIAPATIRASLPGTRAARLIRVQTAGHTIYESKLMKRTAVGPLVQGSHTLTVGPTEFRIGVFVHDGVTLYLGAALNEINADKSALIIALLIVLPLCVAIVAGGGWLLARKALAPIREIAAATEQITVHRLDQRLPVLHAGDEIGRLAQVLNSMLDRLETSFHQATRFSADASHELKTPLTVLRNIVEELLDSPTVRGADQRKAQVLLEQTLRISSITESLLLLSRADAGQLKVDSIPADLGELIAGCAEDADAMAQDREIAIETKLPEKLTGLADPGRLSQILLNLLENAVKYNRAGGRISVTARREADGRISIAVGNTGARIPADKRDQIFNRFFRFTGDRAVAGHGLGLSIARELARAHGGDLVLERSDEDWTVFVVTLPAAASNDEPSLLSPPNTALTIPQC